jgi:uncharacterized protein (TIGR03435 family)
MLPEGLKMKRAVGVLLFFCCVLACAQSTPAFEAADVHASAPTAMPFMDQGFLPNGRFQVKNATLVDLIRTAWNIDGESVIGGPPWLDTDRFDIIAKADPKSTEEERRAMLRALLVDRFKVAVHDDQKELNVYAMTVSKRGVQFQESGSTTATTNCKSDFDMGPPQMVSVSCPSMTMHRYAMQLHMMASGYLTHQVVDFTGLKGVYMLAVKWSPRGAPTKNDAGEPLAFVSIFDAVDKQLGLNLELTKRAVPVLVVDKAERTPTPNDPETIKAIPVSTATEFEAATIKVNKTGGPMKRLQPKPGGRLEVENLTMKELITIAWDFDFDGDRVVGLPKWADADAYDIIAKTAILPGEKAPPFDDVRIMLRSLLIERFQMKTHEEQQPVKVWTLTVSKHGSKLKDADPTTRSNCTRGVSQTGSGSASIPAATYTCQNTTMEQLANAMHMIAPAYIDHPGVDMTGLKGAYDFTITWTPKGAITPTSPPKQPGQPDTPSEPTGGITFFDAVEKLGLHLEGGQKHNMAVLVVDHIEPLGADN